MEQYVREVKKGKNHGLGEAWAALAESKLAEGVCRATIHAPVPKKTPGLVLAVDMVGHLL